MEVVFGGRTDDSEADNGMLSNVFLDPTAPCSQPRQCARRFFFSFFIYTRNSTCRKPAKLHPLALNWEHCSLPKRAKPPRVAWIAF